MPVIQHINEHFEQQEMEDVRNAWHTILDALNRKTRKLSAAEREDYHNTTEQNKLAISRILDFHKTHPQLDAPEIDYDELVANYIDRNFLSGLIASLTEGIAIANNFRITHDYDACKAARVDFNYTKYKKGTDGAVWEKKLKELLPFFKAIKAVPEKPEIQKAKS